MSYFLLDATTIPSQTITAITSIASAESFGTPVLSFTDYQKINADNSIASLESFGIPKLNMYISPDSIVTAEAFGDLVIGSGVRTIYIMRVPSAEEFGILHVKQKISPSSITSLEAFGNPKFGPYTDEPFEKSKQSLSNWKPIKQEIGKSNVTGETVWDSGLTTWDNGATKWDAIAAEGDIMEKAKSSTVYVTQGKQASSTFSKSSQRTTSFTKIKET